MPGGPISRFPDPRRILATLRRAAATSLPAVADGRASGVVKVTATAQPGPAGVLTAPLSGAPCLWYRSVVTPWEGGGLPWRPDQPPPFAPSDLPPTRASLFRAPTEQGSSAPLLLADGAASVLVDPAAADVDSSVITVNRVVPTHPGGLAGRIEQEWIIPVGAPLFACGTVARGPQGMTLAPDGAGVLLVSTKPEQQVLARNAYGAARRPGGPALLPILIGAGVLLVVVIVAVAFVVAG